MKTNAIIRIILWSILILVLVCVLLFALGFSRANGVSWESVLFSGEDAAATQPLVEPTADPVDRFVVQPDSSSPIQLPAEEVRQLKIGWARGSVSILPGSGDQILVEEAASDGGEGALFWSLEKDGELEVFSSDPSGALRGSEDRALTITVPVDWVCQELEVETSSAQLNVQELTIEEAEFETASGPARLENCIVNKLSVDTSSGDISFSGSMNELDMDSASGSFTGVLTSAPNQIEVESASGSLDLTLPDDCGFTLSMEALSSNLVSDFETQRKGTQYVFGDGRCAIEFDSMSGDVTLRKPKA